MTIQELAAQLRQHLLTDTRTNGDEFVKLKDGAPQWMTDVIYTAHGNNFPDDTIYSFIDRAAGHLADQDSDADYDTLRESVYEMEPDIYTSDLTAWLHQRPSHIDYMQQAIDEYGPAANAWQLLSDGQREHIHEVAYALLDALNDLVGDEPTLMWDTVAMEARLRDEGCLIFRGQTGFWIVLDAESKAVTYISEEDAIALHYESMFGTYLWTDG